MPHAATFRGPPCTGLPASCLLAPPSTTTTHKYNNACSYNFSQLLPTRYKYISRHADHFVHSIVSAMFHPSHGARHTPAAPPQHITPVQHQCLSTVPTGPSIRGRRQFPPSPSTAQARSLRPHHRGSRSQKMSSSCFRRTR